MKKISQYFLLLFVFSLPWQGMVFITGVGSISRLLGFALIGVVILYLLLKRNAKEPSVLLIVMLLFVLWAAISYIWTINEAATVRRIIQNIQLLAMVWLIWELCNTQKDYQMLMQYYILGLFISMFDMILTFFGGAADSYRIAAGAFNPNRIAVFVAFGIPIAWYLLIKQKDKILFVVNMIFLPLALFTILLTASRTGIIIGAVGLLIVPLTYFYPKPQVRVVITTFFILLIPISIMYYSEIAERIERNIERVSRTPEMIQEGNLSHRQVIWKAGLESFYKKPITGVGSNAFRYSVVESLGAAWAAHSTYIAILVETGIPGMLLFLFIFIIALAHMLRLSYVDKVFYLTLLLTIIIANIPGNLENEKTVWFLFSLFQAYSYMVFRNGKIVINDRT